MTIMLTQIFVAMALTFALGLILGWIIWRYGIEQGENADETSSEFWRGKFEQSRGEFFTQQSAHQALLTEHENLKNRLAGQKSAKS